jgi:5-oxoprolinase (ATP-hydrolysing)
VAEGFLRIAVANMANAIKFISVQRGHDVTEYTLACFGGAGGQHACLVADELGMKRVYIHPLAGVLSAYGMGLAQVRALREEAVERVLDDVAMIEVEEQCVKLAEQCVTELKLQGAALERIEKRVHLKYEGTDTSLPVALGSPAAMREDFERQYRSRFSFLMGDRRLIAETASVEAVALSDAPPTTEPAPAKAGAQLPEPAARVSMHTGARTHATPVFIREDLHPGARVAGPAIIAERNATTIVEPEWEARITPEDHLVLERVVPRKSAFALGTARRPGDARSLQQPLHVDRRADGRAPRPDRLLGEHQGAPRLLLRALRRRRQPDRQCAAHARAPGLDGREHQDR